jgi:hypothetical protein
MIVIVGVMVVMVMSAANRCARIGCTDQIMNYGSAASSYKVKSVYDNIIL